MNERINAKKINSVDFTPEDNLYPLALVLISLLKLPSESFQEKSVSLPAFTENWRV